MKYDSWPPTEEEIKKIKRERAIERPIVLVANPKNQLLFTKEELKKIEEAVVVYYSYGEPREDLLIIDLGDVRCVVR